MRDAQQNNNQILEEDGVVFGVYLAADYCAEHEWGIVPLCRSLGRSLTPENFADRCISKPVDFTLVDDTIQEYSYQKQSGKRETVKTETRILSAGIYRHLDRLDSYGLRWIDDDKVVDLGGAFHDSTFMLRGFTERGVAAVDLIAEGLRTGDLALWMGGIAGNPFACGGLVIVRPSLTPQTLKDGMDAADEERRKLNAASDATGIKDRVPASAYYALSPHWNTLKDKAGNLRKTAHPVIYWLNPTGQRDNNSGYFTVEELDQWLLGTGPIPKATS